MFFLYRHRYLSWILLICLITIGLLLNDIQVAKPGDLEDFKEFLNESIPKYMKQHNIVGAAIGVVRNGEVAFLKGYGYANESQKISVSRHTVFQVASISKTMTAWGVMKLVQDKKIDLDAPVSRYLTRWDLPPSKFDKNGVTIRRLLSHSAGIANVGGGYAGFDNIGELQSLEESLKEANDANHEGVRQIFEPGKKYGYSGGGYTILQLLIEEVTGLPFETYFRNEIFIPLRMNHSSFTLNTMAKEQLSEVYGLNRNVLNSRIFTAKAAAGLYSTVYDLSNWVAAMMPSKQNIQGRGVLPPQTLATMFQPQQGFDDIFPYGLGYSIQDIYFSDMHEIYHTGTNLPGWRSLISIIPVKGEGLVLLTNSRAGIALQYQIRSAWLHWVTGSSTFALRLQKLVNILKFILPIGLSGLVILLTISIFSRNKSKT